MIFLKLYVSELLVVPQKDDDRGWVAAILPTGKQMPDSLAPSRLLDDSKLRASFVFSAAPPPLKSEEDARLLVESVQATLWKQGIERGIVWLQEDGISVQSSSGLSVLDFSIQADNRAHVNSKFSMSLGTGTLSLDRGMVFDLKEDAFCFESTKGGIHFEGRPTPPEIASEGTIALSGPKRGCIVFDIHISSKFLKDTWLWGFQFQVPKPKEKEGDRDDVLVEWAPLADSGSANNDSDSIGFACVIDPSDVCNRTFPHRTFLTFTGQTSLKSYYRTTTGAEVTLSPIGSEQAEPSDMVAGLVFTQGRHPDKNESSVYVTPFGDFAVAAPTAPASKRAQILCGLQGNEFIALEPVSTEYAGDRLRFSESQPSYGYCYPLPQASPVGPPVDLTEQLLDKTFTTSWVTVVSAPNASPKPVYVAQSKGAPLYGQDPVINQHSKNLLGTMYPGAELDEAGSCFPMLPYAGVSPRRGRLAFDDDLIGVFERQFLSPTRRAQIGTGNPVPSALGHQPLLGSNGTEFTVTTPSGRLVTIDYQTGKWEKILLAQLPTPEENKMYFSKPCAQLQQAFQTSDVMLVVTNPDYLGTFKNSLNIENWVLAAQVGENCRYGDYANVIIIKGVKGKLFDPGDTPKSLVANPVKWTQAGDFAAPNGKEDELVPLSQWLLEYFRAAAQKIDSHPDALYFAKFNQIAQDEHWTGILVLHADITALPKQMKGITAGIDDPSLFYAHHVAIETGQVAQDQNGVQLKGSTSVYGLIFYEDPAYDASTPERPVPPAAGSVYDFRLLTLKVLFENSALKHFQSYAQVTLNELFGSQVTAMGAGGNMDNTIILRGTFQENGNAPVYGLGSLQEYTFLVDSNVLNKIEITSAQMTMRQATDEKTNIWFGLNGYLDFVTLQTNTDDGDNAMAVDLFSFGSEEKQLTPRAGLHFSNLGLTMNYPTQTPGDRTFAFDTDEIRFDIASSAIRENSLYRSFALELEDLVSGDGQDNTPDKKGFLNVLTDLRLSGVGGGNWNGLKFRLNLGTPGELAGKVGLNADLLLAWSPEGGQSNNYNVEIGLRLPGVTGSANLLSVQNVLKLSFGQIRLLYAKDPNAKNPHGKTNRRFMLLLTDIAVKFLGLMKIPPNGATMFYLFGNPESEGKASGLGWYAMYTQDSKKDRNLVAASSPANQQISDLKGGRDG